jgi:molybdate transport system substrate-binding protein
MRGAQVVVIALLVAVVAVGAVVVVRGRSAPDAEGGLVVFAPCGMTGPLNAAVRSFRQRSPEADLNVVYDNAIVLVRKIRKGERPDVFVSPGELEMRQMVEEGYVDGGSVRDFGALDLVVIAPGRVEGLEGLADLKKPQVKTISMADPEHNSVGYYGEQALRSLGLWESLKGKILLREYPLEAISLVTTGQVEAGISYLSCPLDTAPEKADKSAVQIVAQIPRDAYPPVRLQVGILRDTKRRAAAERFVDSMVSDQMQQVLSANGVVPVEEME